MTPRRAARGGVVPTEESDGKARRLQVAVAAVRAGRAAAHHHAGLLLLAGEPGALPVAADPGRLRRARRSSSGSTISATSSTTRVTSRRSGSPRCSRCWSPSSGLSIALLLAVFADRVVRGARVYKTLLIWPYAVAAAVAAVLWVFLLNPTLGVLTHLLRALGFDWNYLLNARQALILIVIAAVWKQISYNFLFFLAGLQSIPKSLIEAAAIDGAGPGAALLDDRLPAAVADDVLPARGQHRLRVLRHVRDRRCRRPAAARCRRPTILVFKVYQDGMQALDLGGSAAQSVILMVIVIALTVDPVPLRRAQGAVLMAAHGRTSPRSDRRQPPGADRRRRDRGAAALRRLRRLDAVVRPGDRRADADDCPARTCSTTTARCSRTAARRARRRRSGG